MKANATDCIHPIAQDSQAERDVVRLLRQHLNSNYTEEEQQRLDDLDGCKGVYGLSKRDHDGFLLLRCLKQVEELRKLAIFGIIDRV